MTIQKLIDYSELARTLRVIILAIGLGCVSASTLAQDRLKTMPGYARFQRMSKEIPGSVKSGSRSVAWAEDGSTFEYHEDFTFTFSTNLNRRIKTYGGKRYRYNIASRSFSELTNNPSLAAPADEDDRRGLGRPGRGRQWTNSVSPDGKWTAFYRDCNLWLLSTNGGSTNITPITTDGSQTRRVKYGSANWVYGEELGQTTAIWWSTNSRWVAFYRFDESQVPDYYTIWDESRIQNRLEAEPYMKAGSTNPIVGLMVYDLETQGSIALDVRDGRPFDNSAVGHYVYGIQWSPDGSEVLFHRTNRRQNVMELCAGNPRTGKCRVVVREEWLPSWTANLPAIHWLKDGRRFLWASERSGWRNFYLYDLSGALLSTVTAHPFEVVDILRLDEKAGLLYYTARSGDNPMKIQLHRASLDGHGGGRLTDPAFHHRIDLAPDGEHFIDVAETHDIPPTTSLRDAEGNLIAELARSDVARFNQLGLKRVELLRFKAAGGSTDLYGMLHFPSNFTPWRRYPLLVRVYAGPETSGAEETFKLPDPLTELGFLVATFDSRSAGGRGKKALDSIYLKLGRVEIDDQAAGVKSLWNRRYVDNRRVGIFGTSYGGTASALCLLRYPEVFQAADANSAVTDFRNYDSIYTERYLWIPQENRAGFDAASVLTYVTNLHGRLLLYYGTSDDNVHPSNTLQLVQALQKAGKSFELQVGPDRGHSALDRDRMMEFFIQSLVISRPVKIGKPAPGKPSR